MFKQSIQCIYLVNVRMRRRLRRPTATRGLVIRCLSRTVFPRDGIHRHPRERLAFSQPWSRSERALRSRPPWCARRRRPASTPRTPTRSASARPPRMTTPRNRPNLPSRVRKPFFLATIPAKDSLAVAGTKRVSRASARSRRLAFLCLSRERRSGEPAFPWPRPQSPPSDRDESADVALPSNRRIDQKDVDASKVNLFRFPSQNQA